MNERVLVVVITFNEGEKLKKVVSRFPEGRRYSILFIDDGSTDDTFTFLQSINATVIRHEGNLGVGAGIKSGLAYAKEENFEVVVIMAGNGKMLPEEIDRLLQPLLDNKADYVQGSRYLSGGSSPNLPALRNWAIRGFTVVSNLILGQNGTDITCGFRAYRLSILDDAGININQDWLNQYELEYYLHYKVAKLGYRLIEVPVTMAYPEEKKNYSKIQPFVGWWSMLRPWLFLTLRLKK